MKSTDPFFPLKQSLEGDVYTDQVQKVIYATDASAYREIPQAVTRPKNKEDIRKIIGFARQMGTSVIPRAGGTSLAGQVVGPGIVVDISKYLNKIGPLNIQERWIEIEPGVILAELNQFLAPHGLQFAPETSSANRCCIGGMLGNNSCGLHSLIYGSTREHILEIEGILSDGSDVTFGELSTSEFQAKCSENPELLETKIYQNIQETLANKLNQQEIRNEFPEPKVTRRNNGYALDMLLETDPFSGNGKAFNFCKLLAGSEGTLVFVTKIKLNLIPLPPNFQGLVCAHFNSLEDALLGNIIALRHKPDAIELTDEIILNCTLENIDQRKNRFFIQGNPKAILTIEFSSDSLLEIQEKAAKLEEDLRKEGVGYHFPLFTDKADIKKIWELRKAGLGLLSNIPGDKRSVTVVEDTAVAPDRLPEYIREFNLIIGQYGLSCVYYGHIATGELHLRPLLNLKDPEDVKIFSSLARQVALLVKKYRGSLSGEHGDGRLRGEFIPLMLGQRNYELIRKLKYTWDPQNILNPGKIVDTMPITQDMRLIMGQPQFKANTLFHYEHGDLLRSVEMCNGSGDCRKSTLIGGSMCPTYMATRDEDKSTRARANVLREYLTRPQKTNLFDSEEVMQVLDLCLSCKACKSECPSNIDMAKFKTEFLQQYHDQWGFPLRSLLIAYLPQINEVGMIFRPLTNLITQFTLFKKLIGFAPERKIPQLSKLSLRRWYRKPISLGQSKIGKVYLFADEFTNFNESHIGIKAILLLNKLGYEVYIPKHQESGRTYLSKGLLRKAKQIATFNVVHLSGIISENTPLIGIEPSTILTFRDEYPELVNSELVGKAKNLAKNSLMFEEFIVQEMGKGNIKPDQFTLETKTIKLHGHCQQKAVASTLPTRKMLELPANYTVQEIKSGCCGMAGSFGYEKEHYQLSMQIGEMEIFPTVRKSSSEEIIAAPGTSCRHHIEDGTGRKVLHPVEVMWDALVK